MISCLLFYLLGDAGFKLQKLTGDIDFVNVSFSYPSRPEVCFNAWLAYSDLLWQYSELLYMCY